MQIQKAHIRNFKSVKDLAFDARRVNVFIGEPNTGKSNILEALSVFSLTPESYTWRNIIRFKTIGNLFYDSVLDHPVRVETNIGDFKLEYGWKNPSGMINHTFRGAFSTGPTQKELGYFILEVDGQIRNRVGPKLKAYVAPYLYRSMDSFQQTSSNFLNPPFGDNIPQLLISHSDLRKMVSNVFRDKGYKINLKPETNDIEIAREQDDVFYSYPYVTVSETLRRIVFMMLAIETQKKATLIFDEPESNTFPFYTKFIAERIAQDKTNQYFLTTHNPYLLLNIIEKTPSSELAVFMTTLKNYQTKIDRLTSSQLKEVIHLQHDVFFNLETLSV